MFPTARAKPNLDLNLGNASVNDLFAEK